MESIIRYLEYVFDALLLFCIMYFVFYIQGSVQGGVYNIFGESLAFGLFFYPAIVLGMSIYGTIKYKKWFTMPIITLIVLPYFFNLVTNENPYNLFLLAYLFLSIIGSGFTRLVVKRFQ